MSAHPLLELQRIDLAGDALRAERDGLPERAALAENQARLARLDAERLVAREQQVAHGREEQRIEVEIGDLRAQASEVETTLYSGSITVVSELEGVQAKLQSLRHQQAELEEAELNVLEQVEAIEAAISEIDDQQASIQAQNAELTKSLEVGEARLDGLLAGIAGQREAQLSLLPAPVLNFYEKLRGSARLAGFVAAPLDGGMCAACHTSLPVTLARKIRAAALKDLFHCESCQRILVSPEAAG